MTPYSPPTAGRADKLRLDFNENTVGCSPRVIAALREGLDAAQPGGLSRIRRGQGGGGRATSTSRPSSLSSPTEPTRPSRSSINTYVDDGQEVLLLRPSYAMYRF